MEEWVMIRKSKTFQEGEQIANACVYASNLIWEFSIDESGMGPDVDYFLKHKVKITIEIHCPEPNPFQNDIIDAYDNK